MSLEQIRARLELFICDTHNDLFLLKGKWGAGKTFFWQRLIEESKKKKSIGRKFYSYVSLFGVNSLEELNNAILVSNVESNASKSKKKLSTLSTSLRSLTTNLEKVPALREYTGGMISTYLHFLLDNTLICFDDIERKGNALDLKDIFGLAAVLKEQRNCKVLFIMNDESLEKDALDQFKLHGEKIIDREISFSIAEEEAFGYIFQPSFSNHDLIKTCCLNLHIINIRILQRIKRFIEDITPYLQGIEEKAIENVLRSLILFVWSYHDKASDPPSLEYILNYSPAKRYIDSQYKNKEISPEEKRWDTIISSYSYFHLSDEVDKCLAEFVKTGYIDEQNFEEELNKKNEHFRAQKGDDSYRKVWDIYRNSFDDNEQEFMDKLMSSFRSNMKILPLSDLQSAVSTLREFERNTQAYTLIDEYFSQRNSEKDIEAMRNMEHTIFIKDLKDEYLLSRLHNVWTSKEFDTRSLADVLKAIMLKEYPNVKDIRHMDSFSVDDYYNFFKTEKSDELYFYVRKCLDFGEHDDEHGIYKSIANKAKEALLKIASESKINRLRVSRLYQVEVP